MIFNFLRHLDRYLFLSINHLPHNALLDVIGKLLSSGSGFIWFFLMALIIILQDRKLGKKVMFGLVLAGLVTQVLVVIVFKPFFARPRPDLVETDTIAVHNNVDSLVPFLFSGYDYAFPSGHATIAFAAAYILSSKKSLEKKRKNMTFLGSINNKFYLLATLIAFSRIYLGKHYPSDVLAGAMLGLAVGWGVLEIFIITRYNDK